MLPSPKRCRIFTIRLSRAGANSFLALAALGAILSLCGAKPAADNKPPKSAVPYEGLDADKLKALVGSKFDVIPWTGKPFRYAELVQLVPGKQAGTLKSISFNPDGGGNKRTLQAKALSRLVAGNRVYDVIPARGQKNAFLLIDTKSRNSLVNAKLKGEGDKLWPAPTAEERESAIEENKKLLKKVSEIISDGHFELSETKHFLVCSDLHDTVTTSIGTTLEKTYSALGQKLGVPDNENIFRGKTMVVLFSTVEDLAKYGKRAMDRDELYGVDVLIHGKPDSDSQIAAYVGNDPNEAMTLATRYVAYTFLDRYRSNVLLPKWIREGIAQWTAESVLPGNRNLQGRQRWATEALHESPNLAGFFDGTQFNLPWQPSVAVALIDILIKTDAEAFHDFVLQIKEGVPWREALKYNFDLTPDDLTQQLGRQIGLPDLRS